MSGAGPVAVTVRMWEARAYPGRLAELLSWVCDDALPGVESEPLHLVSEVFAAPDDRVVVISRWRGEPVPLVDPPGRLVARPPHSWDFTPVDR
jgi:hypothetical protein